MNAREGLPTLRRVLSRMHLRVTLFAVAMAGLTVLATGLVVMRGYAHRNLELIAQSASYAVEPAVVFGDRSAIAEALLPFAEMEGVAGLTVATPDGRVIAHWQRPGRGWLARMERRAGEALWPMPVVARIGERGRVVGEIRVSGDASGIGRYVTLGLVTALTCMLLTAAITWWMALRLQRTVVLPLDAIAQVAHAVRSDRALGLRAPPAGIAEIDSLGRDFNALLGDLESWQSRLQHENSSLAHLASHDVLTGLANRVLLEERLGQAIAAADGSDAGFVILYLDANRLKEVNDRFGHAAGDAMLVAIAQRISECVRAGDLAARVGGDEFAIIASPPTGPDDADAIIAKLREAMARPIRLPNGHEVLSSLSIGVAHYPRDGTQPEVLLQSADKAMYDVKQRRQASG
ncbi:diguanylate cyclase [Sphingobium sp. H39-3-25]|uniref:diguanylate cyclase domain-containing protein n=1 Tax=Sphingobium arseniciresistens TaxID=3030834 RepID=UPI0023B95E0E|nr:diguanylate cyclase [Sphingobium arseniciresistens]